MELKKMVEAFVRIYELYKPFRKAFGILLLLSLAVQGVVLAVPYLLGMMIDGFNLGWGAEYTRQLAFVMCAVYAMETPLVLLLAVNRNRNIDIETKRHLSVWTLRKILRFSLGQIINENSGVRQNIIGKGESAVHQTVATFVSEFLPIMVKILITLVALLVACPHVGVVTCAFIILYIWSSARLDIQVLPELKECRALEKIVDAEHSELLANLRLVVLNAQEERIIDEFNRRFQAFKEREEAMWLTYYKNASWQRDPIAKIGFSVIIFWIIHLIQKGTYSTGDLVTAISWSLLLFTSAGTLGPLQRRCLRYYSMINQYFEMLELPTAVVLPKNPITPPKLHGNIEFRNVSFSHPGGLDGEDKALRAPMLHNISFTIEAGETCAIVGHSGAGKTTLMNLLLRGYDPTDGKIQIDGIDLRELDLTSLRKRVGYMEQNAHLWDDTVERNIAFGCDRKLTPDELDDLAHRTGIDRFAHRLGAHKYKTVVGQRGVFLSGGECQRVGIARVLAKNPSVIILDEATNSLDNLNEALIQEAIRNALKGRTGIIIAHRLSTIKNSDKIVVLERGRIVGIGTHDELLSSCEHYHQLVERELHV